MLRFLPKRDGIRNRKTLPCCVKMQYGPGGRNCVCCQPSVTLKHLRNRTLRRMAKVALQKEETV